MSNKKCGNDEKFNLQVFFRYPEKLKSAGLTKRHFRYFREQLLIQKYTKSVK
jgi:5-bromo-4-chloroindolyl phosphate hydrolysis protein